MKTKLTLILFAALFCAGIARAATDRFGSERNEIARTSFTRSADNMVIISSIPSDGIGSLVVRKLIFSGVNASSITFFDANLKPLDVVLSTFATVEYVPLNITGGVATANGTSSWPTQVDVDLWFSSAIMYNKVGGNVPVIIKWDWLAPRKQGDTRP